MLRKIGILFGVFGTILLMVPIVVIVNTQTQKGIALKTWEENQNALPLKEIPLTISYETPIESSAVFGTFTHNKTDKVLPLIQGITPKELERGVAHDPKTVLPGEYGNCLIYGHREQYLWNLKEIQVGDLIKIETDFGVLEFEVYDTFVVSPTDSLIFEPSDKPIITVVTCYPFIYFGPTTMRFVVKASLNTITHEAILN